MGTQSVTHWPIHTRWRWVLYWPAQVGWGCSFIGWTVLDMEVVILATQYQTGKYFWWPVHSRWGQSVTHWPIHTRWRWGLYWPTQVGWGCSFIGQTVLDVEVVLFATQYQTGKHFWLLVHSRWGHNLWLIGWFIQDGGGCFTGLFKWDGNVFWLADLYGMRLCPLT